MHTGVSSEDEGSEIGDLGAPNNKNEGGGEELIEFGDDDYESDHYSPALGTTRDTAVVVDASHEPSDAKDSVTVIEIGSGLKKNLDGSVVAPKVVKKQPKGSRVCSNVIIHTNWRVLTLNR